MGCLVKRLPLLQRSQPTSLGQRRMLHFKHVVVVICCTFFFFLKVGNVVLGTKLNDAQHKRCDVEQSLQTVTN